MRTYSIGRYQYWYDHQTRAWWGAKYDHKQNQIGDAFFAPTRTLIEREINALVLAS